MLAHTDKDVYRPHMSFASTQLNFEDETWPKVTFPTACRATAYSFNDIDEKESVDEFHDHIESAIATLTSSIAKRMAKLCEVGAQFPEEFDSMKVFTPPLALPPVQIPGGREVSATLGPISKALDADNRVPERMKESSPYAYRVTQLDYRIPKVRIEIPGKAVIEAEFAKKPVIEVHSESAEKAWGSDTE
ncbi:MAG: hypothetical protein KIS73_17055 [Enhydrobacter sp.]|nr:hypothetical protein [Enhydrobacter sp.]